MPEDVKDVFGAALLDVQYGDVPSGAKPFGEGLPHQIWKIVEDHEGNTYRAVYTAAHAAERLAKSANERKAVSTHVHSVRC